MKSSNELRTMLRGIDRKSYPAYKALAGAYQFGSYILVIDHVQGDPFASPSSVHVEIPWKVSGFAENLRDRVCKRVALQDHLTRLFYAQTERFSFQTKGSGKSGLISISRCGQEVLERSACEISRDTITVRFHVGFPAFGRTIDAGGLEKILFEFLPKAVEKSFVAKNLDRRAVQETVWIAEDQEELRRQLRERKLAAFVANGAILPRKSGVSDQPMKESVPFLSPKSMEASFVLPHHGEIRGMVVPEGITLIVGGGYHGKSTLLSALQMGVYNHIAGDGREFVLADDTAVKLRAEEGRSIKNTDISLFINDLPNRKDTRSFSTTDASGSTSQAAGVVEGIEAGTRLFLIDEDTSATNFMVRDDFMQQVISREKEPITPFLERARDLYEKAGISTILVAGSSGAFFYIADQIIQMDCYRPVDITNRVKALCKEHQAPRTETPGFVLPEFTVAYGKETSGAVRTMSDAKGMGEGEAGSGYMQGHSEKSGRSVDVAQERGGKRGHGAGRTQERSKVKIFGKDSFSLDRETVDLRYVEQLADSEQTAALAYLTRYALEQLADGKRTLCQIAKELETQYAAKGWNYLTGSYVPGGLARPRIQEVFAALNRYRG